MTLAQLPPPKGVVLEGIDWKTYSRLVGAAFAEFHSVRLTYDRGSLEILSPLPDHVSDAEFLGQLLLILVEELDLPCKSGGSTTLRRRRGARGLEPDCCYWIANEASVRAQLRLDLRLDPPPDVAIEVDLTSSSLDRMGIYAALNVPEVWRLEDGILSFHVIASGAYTIATHSRTFPFVTPADLLPFLALRLSQGETATRQQFRAWVRQHLPGPQP